MSKVKGSEYLVSISENLRRGSVDLIILTLLNREDMYGYQLVQEMEELSKGDYTLTESTLYPVLYRLEDRELISSRRELIGKRRVRVYYHIEPAGVSYLDAIREEYLVTMRGIMNILNASEKGDH
jgi:PadR family transcriptional regulator PadR